jgi:putative membrane protein
MKRSLKEYALISLKGMGMGAADIVPGVSGGTIALITGIYEEFIDSLKSFSSALPILRKDGLKEVWNHVNGNFLVALFLGIAISLLSLVRVIKYSLETHPILLWSFFFGLIVISCYYVGKAVKKWSISPILGLIFGTLLIYYVTSISPSETSDSLLFVFIAGMLAICAMILPGISGAFILVLLGKYKFIIASLEGLKLDVIAVFGAGCIVGILSFSHFLSFMLKKYHDVTIAVLTGFMIGSLNKIWPWKNTLSWTTDRHGESIPLEQINVLPSNLEGTDPQVAYAITLMITGFGLIFILEQTAKKFTK